MKTTARMAAILGAAAMAACQRKAGSEPETEPHQAARLAASARVTIQQAVHAATDRTPGTVVDAELEDRGGAVVWEVEIVGADQKLSNVYVDAVSGAIVSDTPGAGGR